MEDHVNLNKKEMHENETTETGMCGVNTCGSGYRSMVCSVNGVMTSNFRKILGIC
jgi:hypothetical protein